MTPTSDNICHEYDFTGGAAVFKRTRAGGVINGAGVALLTIFDEDGKLQLGETCELASVLIEAGVRSVLVGGTVGEYYALTDSEKVDLFGAVRDVVPPGVPLILHVGGVPLPGALNLARAAVECGADALIALPRGVDDLAEYYREILGVAGSIPVLAYHFPQVGAEIGVDALADLGVAGVKDSSGDADRLVLEVESLDIEVYTGATGLLNVAHQIGAQGALLGLANVQPELCALALEGDVEAQRSLEELGQGIVSDFPGGLKRLAGERWHVSAATRTPPGLRVSQAGTPNPA
jgi:4-hydroxy-tetrahydrodipicolinate synthase